MNSIEELRRQVSPETIVSGVLLELSRPADTLDAFDGGVRTTSGRKASPVRGAVAAHQDFAIF